MSALDVIIAVIVSLFVVYLIVLAASEPRYTWQPETLDEMLDLLARRTDAMKQQIAARILPILEDAISSLERIAP